MHVETEIGHGTAKKGLPVEQEVTLQIYVSWQRVLWDKMVCQIIGQKCVPNYGTFPRQT